MVTSLDTILLSRVRGLVADAGLLFEYSEGVSLRGLHARRKEYLLKQLVFVVVLLVTGATAGGAAHSFYVAPDGSDAASGTSPDSPFATLERARDAIRALKTKEQLGGPVGVCLRGGTYSITTPFALTSSDSGSPEAPITYTAYGNERPVLSGGRRITGWRHDKNGIWVTTLPDVKAGRWCFRQLYVNGELRHRARIPNRGFLRVAGFPDGGREVHYHTDCRRFEYAPGDLDPRWTNLTDVEIIVYHFWTDSHLPIQSLDTEKRIVTFAHKAGKVFTDDFTSRGARYIVENVFEGLDQPGEWYVNRTTGMLYYLPHEGEDPTRAEIIAPVAPALVVIEGKPTERRFVGHIRFRGIEFKHTNFKLPRGNSNDRQGSASVPAAIRLTGARHITFERCTVKSIGTFAFELAKGCTQNRIVGNTITYIAAGGFRINGGTFKDHPLERTGFNVVTDNVLHHYGEVYPSAVGVLLMHTEGNRIEHNHIHHGWYTGISLGWSWGYQRSVSRDNVVAFNHIHHIGQGLLSDMGGIYTLGVSPGTVIRNNHIHHVEANHYGSWGIYNDEGSTHILIEKNIVHDTKFAGYNIHFAKEVTVRNNVFAFGRLQQLSRSRVEPHESVYFENNIVYWTEGTLLDNNWRNKPYTFHFHPKNAQGTREVSRTFSMDWNVYYNPNLPVEKVMYNGLTLTKWREAGNDTHSAYVDPLFVDPANRDFRLKPDSPALRMGFDPIDMDTIGPSSEAGAGKR